MQTEVIETKETEIGPLPKEWQYEKLKEHLEQIRGGTSKSQNQEGIGFPVTRIETISDSKIDPAKVGYIKELIDKDKEKFFLREEDILVSHINSEPHLGKSAIYEGVPENLVHGMNLVRIRTKKSLNAHFLNNLFKYYRKQGRFIAIASRAVNQSSINQGKMKNLEIPVPPITEQQKIASILSTVRDAIEQTEAVIQATRELKKSMMKHLFTYGPVPVDQTDRVELEETEIGQVPVNWEVIKLDEISDITSGGTPSRKKKEYWEDGDIPWVKTGEVDYEIIDDTKEKITKEGLNNSSAKLFPKGTVLIAMYGQGITRGRVAKLGLDATSNQACAAFLNLKGITNDYLFYALQFEYERLRSHAHGANQKNLSATLLKQFRIAIPDKKIQTSIVNSLSFVDQKMRQEIDKKLSLIKLFDSLLESLMTAKIRVL